MWQQFSRLPKRAPLWPVLLLALSLGACSPNSEHSTPVGVLPFTLTNSSDVAYLQVNGVDVAPEELQLIANGERAIVADFFVRTYGAEINDAFWNQDFSGDSPAKRLLRRTVHRAVELTIQQQLAQQMGLRQESSYAALVAAWKAENARRAAAQQQGETLYGPVQYTLDAFFLQDAKSLELALIQRLNEEQYFKPYEGRLSFRSNESRMQRMEKSFQAYMEDQFSEAKVLANEAALEALPLGNPS